MQSLTLLSLLISLDPTTALQYTLQTSLSGPAFFDAFDFQATWDTTFGYVHYVDRPTAESLSMLNASSTPITFGAEHASVLDPGANLGRPSLKLVSKESWTRGLFVLDLEHMPANVCGSWPAFWSLGNGPDGVWPKYGEIDIIEMINDSKNNLMALHTSPDCTIAGAGQSGTLLTNDCGKDDGFAGCAVSPTLPNNSGSYFNANGGGVYAMEWTSAAIKIWFFPRQSIPPSILADDGSQLLDTSLFGLPTANFAGSCDIDAHFSNHSLIFNIDFCGSYAGPLFNHGTNCPRLNPENEWSSCNMYVAANPQVCAESYWAVNYLKVFQAVETPPVLPSSSLSSIIPAASSTVVTASGAEGRTSTPSGTIDGPTNLSTVPLSSTTTSLSSVSTAPRPTTSATPIPASALSSAAPPPVISSIVTTTSSPQSTSATAQPTTAQIPADPNNPVVVVETTVIFFTTTISVAPNRAKVEVRPGTVLVTRMG
jgi:hypothetical protein